MANAKKPKPKAKLASKWELHSGDKPQSYELPEGAVLQTFCPDIFNSDVEITCADCGEKIPFRTSRASPLIRHRSKTYVGYLVCGPCLSRERDEHRRMIKTMMDAKG